MEHRSFKQNIKPGEAVAGVVIFAALVFLGVRFLEPLIAVRLMVGMGFGYVLARAMTGFAGSVNRACRTGSTQLMRTLMFLFFVTSIVVAAFAYRPEGFESLDLWVNPVNAGLCLGAFTFGFGMSISSCCASGVMQDLATASPRAILTIIFFTIGVFVGYPLQFTQDWVARSLVSTERGLQKGGGVFFPDLFKWDGFNGYLGAIILTGVLCLIVYSICMLYEKKMKAAGKLSEVGTEALQASDYDYRVSEAKFFSKDTFYHFFVKPFSLIGGAMGLVVLFTVLLAVFKSEWGVSTPYGTWFGRVLVRFGMDPEKLAIFANTTMGGAFEKPIWQNGVSVQDIGILFGTVIYTLFSGTFIKTVKEGFSLTKREFILYCIGGFTMGFGTRLAQGCNAGALYSPIAAFSLSGWVFLPFMVLGGILGNKVYKKTGIRS